MPHMSISITEHLVELLYKFLSLLPQNLLFNPQALLNIAESGVDHIDIILDLGKLLLLEIQVNHVLRSRKVIVRLLNVF